MNVLRSWRMRLMLAALAITAVSGVVFLVPGAAARNRAMATAHQSGTSGSGHTLSVQGHGVVMVPPDQATLTIGVQSRSSDAQSASAKAATKMQAVIAAVKAQGVPDNHIQTTDLSLWYDQQSDSYVASQQITVLIDRISTTGAVLDAAVAAGADNAWGVSFGLKDPSAGHVQALQAAVADARTHADAMASALHVTVGTVVSAGEVSYSAPPVGVAAGAPAPSGATTPVQPGQLTVTADVKVVYSIG